jgi:hypothetical protein
VAVVKREVNVQLLMDLATQMVVISIIILGMSLLGKEGFWGKIEAAFGYLGEFLLGTSLAIHLARSGFKASRAGLSESVNVFKGKMGGGTVGSDPPHPDRPL